PGDSGLQGWTIDLLDSTGKVLGVAVSGADGTYSFPGVGPGSFTIQEELQAGWVQTAPAPPGTYSVSTSSGNDVGSQNFGNFQLVTLSGEVFNDLNGNGTLDPGDPGLQGWTVDLLSGGNTVATTVSGADGSYSFPNVGPGTYTIQEELQLGW